MNSLTARSSSRFLIAFGKIAFPHIHCCRVRAAGSEGVIRPCDAGSIIRGAVEVARLAERENSACAEGYSRARPVYIVRGRLVLSTMLKRN